MLKLCSLTSGSSGNASLLVSNNARILIDVGIPLSEAEGLLTGLNIEPSSVSAVLVTHRHGDHAGGVKAFAAKYNTPVYFPKGSGVEQIMGRGNKNSVPFPAGDFFLNDVTVCPFEVSHDVPCVGYSFLCAGSKATVVTDSGVLHKSTVDAISDSGLVLIEANHDVNLLMNNPNYSPWLKQRILSSRGHLSNDASARIIAQLIRGGASQIILGHLSEENNYPELAFTTVKNHLAGEKLLEGRDYKLAVAAKRTPSPLFDIC